MALVHFIPRAILTGAALWLQGLAVAADFSLRTNDVIAFVGGEDIVAMQEFGYVELFLAQETLKKGLRFRNLGWEGDTVFEQKRDLNFPSWEQTLARIGATVVVAQFGQAESLRGRDSLSAFTVAAEKFLSKLAGTNRQVLLLQPKSFEVTERLWPYPNYNDSDLSLYSNALRQLARRRGWHFVDTTAIYLPTGFTRDGMHLSAKGQWALARALAQAFDDSPAAFITEFNLSTATVKPPNAEQLRQAILIKNRLWFDYWRPQNWAFLAGDRTEQPSSRDHRDPKVRWFPSEMQKFLPLIEAKEMVIRELAANLDKK